MQHGLGGGIGAEWSWSVSPSRFDGEHLARRHRHILGECPVEVRRHPESASSRTRQAHAGANKDTLPSRLPPPRGNRLRHAAVGAWMIGNGVALPSHRQPSALLSSSAVDRSSVLPVTLDEYQPRRVLISVLFMPAVKHLMYLAVLA